MNIKKGDTGKYVERAPAGTFSIGYGGEMELALISEKEPFGSRTEKAVNKFKGDNGLPQNGIIDDETASLLWDRQREEILSLTDAYEDLRDRANNYKASMKTAANKEI